MAKIVIGGEVNIPVGDAEKNVKSLKLQLRELKQELQTMDEADPQFLRIAQQAGELEDRITAVNEQVRAFASPANERNLAGIVGVTQGIAGGFAAAQGAAALFAGENEELQKSMLKVQAAMALVMGMQEIQNTLKKESAAMTFLMATAEKVYAAAVGQSTGAMKKFRLALLATGIGALVVLVGVLVSNWDKMTKAAEKAGGPLKEFGEIFNKVKQIASGVFDAIISYYKTIFNIITKALKGDFGGAIDEARNIGKNVAKAYSEGVESEMKAQEKARQDAITQSNLALQKRELQRIEAAGKDSYAAKKAILENELKLLEAGSEEFLDKQNEIAVLQIANEKKINDERTKIQEEAQKKREEERKKKEEEAKRLQEEAERKRLEKEKQIAEIIESTRRAVELGELDGQARALRALEMSYQDQLAIVGDNEEALKLLNAQFQQEKTAIRDEYATKERERLYAEKEKQKEIDKKANEDRLKLEQDYQTAKRDLAVSGAQGMLSAISDINAAFTGNSEKAARKAFGIQKALSIAETIIGTYSAAQTAYANVLANPAWKLSPDGGLTAALVSAGIAVAGGLARVAAISKTQFQGAAPSAPSASGGSVPQPQSSATNLSPDITRTRLGGGDNGEITTRVIVVESDITNTQNRVRGIDRRATVGDDV